MDKANKNLARRWQFALLLLLLGPVVGGFFMLMSHTDKEAVAATHPGSSLSQHLLQAAGEQTAYGAPTRKFPPKYKEVGSVDDRYTMAVDPETGQTVLHDALGGVGTNNTSVEGDRAKLAKDMVALENYANQHQHGMKPEDYNWLKRMARAGMQLAFGTPGLPSPMQPPIKAALLSEFHDISANPSQSVVHAGIFTQAEQASQVAEATYQKLADQQALATGVMPSSGISGSLLGLDPVSAIAATTSPDYTSATTLTAQVNSSLLLVPDTTSQLTANSSFNILSFPAATTAPADASLATTSTTNTASPAVWSTSTAANTISSATATQSSSPTTQTAVSANATISPNLTTSASVDLGVVSTTLTVSPSALLTTDSTTATTGSSATTGTATTTTPPPTVQEYYNTLLGPAQ